MFSGMVLLTLCGFLWVVVGIITSTAALRKENLFWIQGAAGAVTVLLAFLHMVIFPASRIPGHFNWLIPGLLVLAGVANTLTFYWMGKAMKHGPNGIIWVIIQSAMAGPFLMGVLCFHDRCSAWKVLGLVLILGGILNGSFAKNEGGGRRCVLKEWLPVTLLAYFMTVIAQCLNSLPSYLCRDTFSTAGRALFLYFGGILCCGICFASRPSCREGKRPLLPALVLGVVNVISALFLFLRGLNLLAEAGAAAIGYPVTVGVCIAGFELYSVTVLHEKLNWYSLGSILGILTGITLLALPL